MNNKNIEEDIKKLEQVIKLAKDTGPDKTLALRIENILVDRERLLHKANRYDRLVDRVKKKIKETRRIAKNKDIIPSTVKEERIDGSYVYSQRFNADGYIAEIIVNILQELIEEE